MPIALFKDMNAIYISVLHIYLAFDQYFPKSTPYKNHVVQ